MTHKTVRALATLAAVALLIAACGGGSSDDESGDGASDEATEEPAEESEDNAEDIDLEGLDYAGALFTIEDFEGFVPGDYVAADEASTAGAQLRGLCGEGQLGPEAVAGELLELQDAEPTVSFTTSVDAFASEEEAAEAYTTSRDVAESCERNFTSNGDAFEQTAPIVIGGSGGESFDLFAVKTDTLLLVGDHFVREGQFVFDVRIVLSQGSVFYQTIETLATAAVDKFLDWVEETTG